jgi:hypothetical protein
MLSQGIFLTVKVMMRDWIILLLLVCSLAILFALFFVGVVWTR